MKHTLSIARVARDDVKKAHAESVKRLQAAESELATILRRGQLAAQIDDTETVAVAERFAESQRATIAVLERKVAVQLDELALADRTVAEMEADLKAVTGLGGSGSSTRPVTPPSDDDDAPSADPSDFHPLNRAAREQSAEERLAELKRKMGRE